MPHKYRRINSWELKRGMIVKMPKHYFDEGTKRPITDIWPNPPAELRVDLWDLEDGESRLYSLTSNKHLDLNTADYPPTFMMRVDEKHHEIKPTRKGEEARRRGSDKQTNKGSSLSAHLSRAVRDDF